MLGRRRCGWGEDGACAGSERTATRPRAFFILIATAEAEAAFGEIFADGDFFLETAAANAREECGL